MVVGDALHNVPQRGWWGWDDRWTLPYHPETWYLEPVSRLIWERVALTVVVALASILFTWVVAIPAGILAAVRQ